MTILSARSSSQEVNRTVSRPEQTPEEFSDALAAQLRAEKAAEKVTIDQLVAATGASKMTIRRYLNGERAIPVPVFAMMADALGVSAGVLIQRAQDRL